MSLISGKYWTGDPTIKPDAWGPVEDVQAAILENADNIYCIDPTKLKLFMPLWGPEKQVNYITAKRYGISGTTNFTEKSVDFNGTGYISTSNSTNNKLYSASELRSNGLTIICRLKSQYFTLKLDRQVALFNAAGSESHLGPSSGGLELTYGSVYDKVVAKIYSGSYKTISNNNDLNINPQVDHTVAAIFGVDNLIRVFLDKTQIGSGSFTCASAGFDAIYSNVATDWQKNTSKIFDAIMRYIIVSTSSYSNNIISHFHDNPYGLLQPIIRRSYFIPSGDITIKTIYDSGFCSDTISGLSNQLSVLDIGSGIDGFYGMSADLSISDTGSGSENINPVASVSVNDTASAIDIISNILNYCSVVDSGFGADSISNILASIAVADAGAGLDIINVLKELLKTVTDSCSCVDNVSQITVSSSVSDSASGVDIISQILADISVTDNGSGTDFLSLITDILKTISDIGTGVDAVSIQPVSISVQDVGLALDLIGNIAVALSIVDTATADEIISTIKTKLVAVSDSAIGSDNQSISVSLTVADTMTAIDTIKQIINSLSISDSGSGIESITKIDLDNTPSGRVRITITLKAPGISITSRSTGINISTQ